MAGWLQPLASDARTVCVKNRHRFILPNSTTVRTTASMQLGRAGQQGPILTL